MAVHSPVSPPRSKADEPRRRRFTLEEYHRLIESGILGPEDRVELIEGEIFEMAPIGSPHAACVHRLQALLADACGMDRVRNQSPIELGDSEPEPDLVVVVGREDYYAGRHPGADDVQLVVEVSSTSLRYDRELKLPLYARHGVPEVWIVDLAARRIEVHREPAAAGYRSSRRHAPGDEISPLALPELRLRVDQILG